MTHNAENRPWLAGGSHEDSAAGGSSAVTVQQAALQSDGLFPVGPVPLTARPLVLITRGRVEYLAHCPKCADWHRHVHLGTVTGPCGTEYELQSRRAKGAA
ncbi:hypothetical protein [Streptomyces sp. 1-11]|uniref:hypothetical protein n=1 Tax=Streptomyces sp. 1-11 TaxID=2590549 RepID=UPI0011703186|nr:hypothetical protein [Streptomyces sp. 1-11]GEK03501.1 hypothetical protein TNCT1_57770 [Streptomyces sp. 1-11]